jgi:hypothetical protein
MHRRIMKANPIPVQVSPLTEPCPWCAGDLEVGETSAACAGCAVEVALASEAALAAAA